MSVERLSSWKISLHVPYTVTTKQPQHYTGHFIMFSVITNIYNKKPKGRTLTELFTDAVKLKVFFTTTDVRCVHHG
jgi:Na+-translocating ferredoxin:NAD+ oxidoreductase RnfD subunit